MNAHAQELAPESESTALSGLDRECIDVARRMNAEAKRLGVSGAIVATRYDVRRLHRLATKLHRSYENACNREMSRAEELSERRVESIVIALVYRLGLSVRFNGDPRGAPIQIPCGPEHANGFGGDCIVIPCGPARDYAKKGG